MARTPLTLAALATSAVPGLQVSGSRTHHESDDEGFTGAVIAADGRELLVRVPRNSAAEVLQSAEMLGTSALHEGSRAALPFAVPETLGMTRAGDTRAVVTTYLNGGRIETGDLDREAILLQPIAEALAAIHRLPATLVKEAGLPVRSAEESRAAVSRIVDRAADTRLLPDTVHRRWLETLDSERFWDFAPTVVHGSFDADRLLISDDQITGVSGWNDLAVDDPAVDFAWLLGAQQGVFESVVARYSQERGISGMTELHTRARFRHELEVARWLLHGVESHDQSIIDDAVSMLDRLVDRLSKLGGTAPERPATTPEEVDRLLADLPEIPEDPRSETAEYEALDEDRVFDGDADFAEPSGAAEDPSAPHERISPPE